MPIRMDLEQVSDSGQKNVGRLLLPWLKKRYRIPWGIVLVQAYLYGT